MNTSVLLATEQSPKAELKVVMDVRDITQMTEGRLADSVRKAARGESVLHPRVAARG